MSPIVGRRRPQFAGGDIIVFAAEAVRLRSTSHASQHSAVARPEARGGSARGSIVQHQYHVCLQPSRLPFPSRTSSSGDRSSARATPTTRSTPCSAASKPLAPSSRHDAGAAHRSHPSSRGGCLMSTVGQMERETQNRVVEALPDRLGYEYGGNLEDQDNTNVDEALLRQNLLARGDRRGTRQSRDPAAADRRLARRRSVALRRQPQGLRPAALRREGQARRRRELRDRLADRLGQPGREPLRGRRGGHGQGRAQQAPRHRALRQRHRAGRHRAQALVRQRQRGHPPEHRQPEAALHPAVLHDGAAAVRRQRRRGPALRRDRDAGEVLARVEGAEASDRSRTRSTAR